MIFFLPSLPSPPPFPFLQTFLFKIRTESAKWRRDWLWLNNRIGRFWMKSSVYKDNCRAPCELPRMPWQPKESRGINSNPFSSGRELVYCQLCANYVKLFHFCHRGVSLIQYDGSNDDLDWRIDFSYLNFVCIIKYLKSRLIKGCFFEWKYLHLSNFNLRLELIKTSFFKVLTYRNRSVGKFYIVLRKKIRSIGPFLQVLWLL